jgi:hypothetical protein
MKDFTREEGEAKIGKHVRAKVSLPSIPTGTEGRVVQIYEAINDAREGYDVCVQWEFSERKSGKPLRDWFSKAAYQERLTELSS